MVTNLLNELTGIPTTLSPELAVLDIDLIDIPSNFKILIHHILFAARLAIAQNWKTPHTPSLVELIRRVHFSCHSELFLSPFNPSPAKRYDAWSTWILS